MSMRQKLEINTKALLDSELDLGIFVMLQIIYEKHEELFEKYKYFLAGSDTILYLCTFGYIKYAGQDTIEPEHFQESLQANIDTLEVNDFILLEKATKLFKSNELSNKLNEVDGWINDYRSKFKSLRHNAMGDPKACLKKMKMFLTDNPQYSKDDIFKAVDLYISETDPTYIQQADYFIYKSGMDKIPTSRLTMYCERIKSGDVIQDPVSLNRMI